MKRRSFIKYASSMVVLLSNGQLLQAGNLGSGLLSSPVKLRFVVASDGHYGQPGTPYEQYYKTVISRINEEHALDPFAFCMINGDIIHNDKTLYPAAKAALDVLKMKYYVSQGNHDHVTAEEWESIWQMPVDHDFRIGGDSFLIATTSNEKGDYLCPDIPWVAAKLQEHQHQKNVFIFLHINPGGLTKNAVDCPALFDVFKKYKNVRAIFNGHDHDESGIKIKNEIPFIFDAHFGGDWGTAYRGFRVVELRADNSLLTYIMNPLEKINEVTT